MKKIILIILSVLTVSFSTFASNNSESTKPEGDSLKVVATTSIIGDVVDQVLQDSGELTVLMPVGQNPHSYTPAPRDIAALESADIIFINGLDLEEQLIPILEGLNGPRVVEVSHGIKPREMGHHDVEHQDVEHHDDEHHDDEHHEDEYHEDEYHEDEYHEDEYHEDEYHDDEHDHSAGDPHFWFSPINVMHWVHEIEETLSDVDPDNVSSYTEAAENYGKKLEDLDVKVRELVETVAVEDRKIVMGHETLGYFADDYGFTIIANILPSFTDQAEPSAKEIAEVVEIVKDYDVKAIFIGGTAPKNVIKMAEAVSEENNRSLPVVSILSGSLTDSGRGQDYIDFILYNTEQIVNALKR